jgi:uncharacterized membrane protein YcaP (DUF421 family)
MDAVFRAATIYFFLLVVFRIAGSRSLSQMTTFDFVLLLIIAEATQQGLIGDDYSITQAVLLKEKLPLLDKWMEGVPMVIVEDGKPLRERMRGARVDESDVLVAARERQGLERMDQIKFAVLERTGQISIVPKKGGSD